MSLLRKFKYCAIFQEFPLGTIFKKVCLKMLQLLEVKLEAIVARFLSGDISDEDLLLSLAGFSAFKEVVQVLRGKRPPFFGTSAKEEIVSLIRQQFPHLEREIVEEADKICSHVFDLLGSGPVNLDEFVEQHGGREKCGYLPWHFDFKTGYGWGPKKYYKEIRPAYGRADIKVPWELSRFHHLVVLGQAYWLTDDEKYALEFVRQVENWIDRNPPNFGVNWACTMDVAIRVANWILGFYFFKESPTLTDGFLIKFLKSLLIHGRHIMANLENRGITNNHYLANLVGLIYLGIAFPELKEAKKWLEFGIQELIKEMDKQVYNDGMDFEASTCYHRLALEFFFYATLLCKMKGIEMPQAFVCKLKKMFDFVLYVLKPNGRMPQIGDNDNGRLHVLGKREILDMTYLLTFAALFYDDPTYKIDEFGFAPEALWVFGPEAYERWNILPGRSVEELESYAFPEGGIYVMRYKRDYMVISCGPNGQGGIGGHAHNDKLSFELCIGGEDVIVDPGTYVYTLHPNWRNLFRSTAYHNTIVANYQDQNPISEDKLFYLRDLTHCRCIVWENRPDKDLFIGKHEGYIRIRSKLGHIRKIEFMKNSRTWEITDYLYISSKLRSSQGNMLMTLIGLLDHLSLNLFLDPRIRVEIYNHKDARAVEVCTRYASIPNMTGTDPIVFVFSLSALRLYALIYGWKRLRFESGWYSAYYGHKEKTTVLHLETSASWHKSFRKSLKGKALRFGGIGVFTHHIWPFRLLKKFMPN
ncbi:MAG: alginate lyase family protein [Candidatus Methanomethyliaceae archaeon]